MPHQRYGFNPPYITAHVYKVLDGPLDDLDIWLEHALQLLHHLQYKLQHRKAKKAR